MSTTPRPSLLPSTVRDKALEVGHAVLRWLAQWLHIARLAAQIMTWALSPRSYPRDLRPVIARHLYQSAGPPLLWYVSMLALFGWVLVPLLRMA